MPPPVGLYVEAAFLTPFSQSERHLHRSLQGNDVLCMRGSLSESARAHLNGSERRRDVFVFGRLGRGCLRGLSGGPNFGWDANEERAASSASLRKAAAPFQAVRPQLLYSRFLDFFDLFFFNLISKMK